jgi:hypothetical protein
MRPELPGPPVAGTPEELPMQSGGPAWSLCRLCVVRWVEPHPLRQTRVRPVRAQAWLHVARSNLQEDGHLWEKPQGLSPKIENQDH